MDKAIQQIFNSDLLLNEGEGDLARREYPSIADFLFWPALHEAFKPHEKLANHQKLKSRNRGLWALTFGLAALWLAVLEPRIPWDALGAHASGAGPVVLAILVVALTLVSVFLGSRILGGKLKSEWLHHRAATERLRQLHFQFLVRQALRIAGSDAATRAALLLHREELLQNLKHRLRVGVAPVVDEIIDDTGGAECWIEERPAAPCREGSDALDVDGAAPRGTSLDELFRAYTALRFRHQIDFAQRKLGHGYGIWPWEPKGQARRIDDTANVLTVLVVLAAIAGAILAAVAASSSPIDARLLPWLQTCEIMAALAVLALRVLDEGLRPRAEVAKFRLYHGETKELLQNFLIAESPGQKLELMQRMEELSYRELREFLTLHDEAAFVL